MLVLRKFRNRIKLIQISVVSTALSEEFRVRIPPLFFKGAKQGGNSDDNDQKTSKIIKKTLKFFACGALTLTENHVFLVMKKHIYGPPKSIIFENHIEKYRNIVSTKPTGGSGPCCTTNPPGQTFFLISDSCVFSTSTVLDQTTPTSNSQKIPQIFSDPQTPATPEKN